MIKKNGVKVTATEYAKLLVFEKGDNASYWLDGESWSKDIQGMTDREKDAVNDALNRQLARIRKFLAINIIENKIY